MFIESDTNPINNCTIKPCLFFLYFDSLVNLNIENKTKTPTKKAKIELKFVPRYLQLNT